MRRYNYLRVEIVMLLMKLNLFSYSFLCYYLPGCISFYFLSVTILVISLNLLKFRIMLVLPKASLIYWYLMVLWEKQRIFTAIINKKSSLYLRVSLRYYRSAGLHKSLVSIKTGGISVIWMGKINISNIRLAKIFFQLIKWDF